MKNDHPITIRTLPAPQHLISIPQHPPNIPSALKYQPSQSASVHEWYQEQHPTISQWPPLSTKHPLAVRQYGLKLDVDEHILTPGRYVHGALPRYVKIENPAP
ncbi:hypothetical protein E2C01_099703 [Portunus trituberculatus]|uniref:Uncharacterized protein n=1 Tax=Portunus trituberculatus TaxID=210409 RepID=A0A5B7KHI3_PORTR|nr:hypothetical protein [Portunus trituberculatus]